MPALRGCTLAVVEGLAVVAALASAPTTHAGTTRHVHTLTVTAASSETERGSVDAGPAALSRSSP